MWRVYPQSPFILHLNISHNSKNAFKRKYDKIRVPYLDGRSEPEPATAASSISSAYSYFAFLFFFDTTVKGSSFPASLLLRLPCDRAVGGCLGLILGLCLRLFLGLSGGLSGVAG
jgi:hypothetical protein